VSFRTSLIVLNILAFAVIAGVILWRVVSIRRNPEDEPRNLTPFLPDEDLEGRRLERVLGWSLLFTLVIALALPAYFILEPTRSANLEDHFLEQSIERGAVLFANAQSEEYVSDFSLLCANCHGVDGTGGSATQTLQPESDECLIEQNQGNAEVPQCLPVQVNWQAPDLTRAALIYDRGQLTQIITYGRAGTPMPPWGVKSGKGAKNEQSIEDLVNYIESIGETPEQAKKNSADAIDKYRADAIELVGQKEDSLAETQAALAEAQAEATPDPDVIENLTQDVATAQTELATAIELNEEAQGLTDGAILFRLNCARCHTKGWSYNVTEPARVDLPPLAPQGTGAYGPNLTGDAVELQFPGEAGRQGQFDWVALGAPANDQYGLRGISTGRMPHFSRVLTEDMIDAIIDYERDL